MKLYITFIEQTFLNSTIDCIPIQQNNNYPSVFTVWTLRASTYTVAHLAWQNRVCYGRAVLISLFSIKPHFLQMSLD